MTCTCNYCDHFEERAAIREHDGGQARDAAERAAATDTIRKLGKEARTHLEEQGKIKAPEQARLTLG